MSQKCGRIENESGHDWTRNPDCTRDWRLYVVKAFFSNSRWFCRCYSQYRFLVILSKINICRNSINLVTSPIWITTARKDGDLIQKPNPNPNRIAIAIRIHCKGGPKWWGFIRPFGNFARKGGDTLNCPRNSLFTIMKNHL